jgi:tachykinin receptor 3
MIMTYFLPMISMCYTYSRIGLELWGSRAIGEASEVQAESIKSKRKVMFASTFCFVL